MLTRRTILLLMGLGIYPGLLLGRTDNVSLGSPEAFSFDILTEIARMLSTQDFVERPSPYPDVVSKLDVDQFAQVRQRFGSALYHNLEYPVTFFHLGKLFPKPVRMFVVAQGTARQVVYREDLFDSPSDSPARRMPEGAGFSGFKLHDAQLPEPERQNTDWTAFLGSSYFRSSGDGAQYGISARGIAINTAVSGQVEEFPDFVDFYIAEPENGIIDVFALLDGPSVAGAYHFKIWRRPFVTMEVQSRLFFRKEVAQLGIAPATSMYYHSETYRAAGNDFRPEVHDSDGLQIWSGTGEQIWRPLNAPPHPVLSSFRDQRLKGFGLMQRDRDFGNYHDEVHSERRPSLWIEPIGDWGPGSVKLFELPTDNEYQDNIVAFWSPEQAVQIGERREFSYRLRWATSNPLPSGIGRCTATRLSKGVVKSSAEGLSPQSFIERTFLVEFAGPSLSRFDPTQATPVLTMSRGSYEDLHAWPEADGSPQPWRVIFKVVSQGDDPLEMRLFLKHGAETISETWCFQYYPKPWL